MEAIQPNAPLPRGKEVDLWISVDSNHVGDKQTMQSRTGFMICMNMSLINWYSQKQSTLETSVFGAKFVAMKTGVETLPAYQLKFTSEVSYIYGGNMLIIYDTSKPKSILKKSVMQ